jgi:ankyrin repeat protein
VFNHLPIVELLLQAGAAVDSRSLDGFTPLLNAARAEAPVVTALLNAGADPAAQEARLGWRPLDRFAEHANALAVRLLLNAGAEVDARDFSGQTALMDAAEAGSAECVELLLRAGANPAVTREGQTARRWPRNTATITSLPTWPPATQQPRRRQTGLTGQIRHEDRGGVHAT